MNVKWMTKSALFALLLLGISTAACGGGGLPPPQPPPVVEPPDPAYQPTDGIPLELFFPFSEGTTSAEQVFNSVGRGRLPAGKVDDAGVRWFYYHVKSSNYDAALGFRDHDPGPGERLVLYKKYVGY